MFRVLCIGDPHYKGDNTLETDQMATALVRLVVERKPDLTIILGDVLHTHEKLYQDSQRRAIRFMRDMRNVSKHLIVLVGNHDRPNNNVFLTDEHPFTAMEEWERTTIVWKPEIQTYTSRSGVKGTFLFVPYVPVGRFAEAIRTVMDESDIPSLSGVFAHQEFKGAKMGAIVSKHGDEWAPEYPLVVSGHVHDFDVLQPNVIYTGTPIQHGFADSRDKKVMFFEYGTDASVDGAETIRDTDGLSEKLVYRNYERFSLGIPSKIHVKISALELLNYTVPADAHVKLSVEGDPEEIRKLLKLDSLKPLLATQGLVVKIIDKRIQAKTEAPVRSNMSFQRRLISAMHRESGEICDLFGQLFGALPPPEMLPSVAVQQPVEVVTGGMTQIRIG